MTEEAASEGEEPSEASESLNPAAVSIALGRRSSEQASALDAEATAFLRDDSFLMTQNESRSHKRNRRTRSSSFP